MADKIRIGIVGASVSPLGSLWGARAHIPAIQSLPEYEVTAVCTAHDDTAKASAEAFGAKYAYSDINKMVENPEVDLVVVVVRVPVHYQLVMPALRANKAVFCEWPLGANLKEAEEMASLAKERNLSTIVGLQARSDPGVMYARELVQSGEIGEIMAVNLTASAQAQIERASDRSWQGERKAGANPMTIPGGHGIDAMCHIVGEFDEVSARLTTMSKEWKVTDLNTTMKVDAPDNIAVVGGMKNGAEATIHITTVMSNPLGYNLDIWGRKGYIRVGGAGSANIGPTAVFVGKARESASESPIPDKFKVVPEGTPAGQARNVAQAYVRYADSKAAGTSFDPDFEQAVVRHRMIDAFERSAAEGKSIKL